MKGYLQKKSANIIVKKTLLGYREIKTGKFLPGTLSFGCKGYKTRIRKDGYKDYFQVLGHSYEYTVNQNLKEELEKNGSMLLVADTEHRYDYTYIESQPHLVMCSGSSQIFMPRRIKDEETIRKYMMNDTDLSIFEEHEKGLTDEGKSNKKR